jgi:hypothetical protein
MPPISGPTAINQGQPKGPVSRAMLRTRGPLQRGSTGRRGARFSLARHKARGYLDASDFSEIVQRPEISMADRTTEGAEPPAGKPKYDQEFFLALAAKGKDAWNAWRNDPGNKGICVTFAGIDFSEEPRGQIRVPRPCTLCRRARKRRTRSEISFAGFEFGDGANFSGCKWRGGGRRLAEGPQTFTPGGAHFAGASFGYQTNFTGAKFGDCADFTAASFGGFANFTRGVFGDTTWFFGATFGHQANFTSTRFGDAADFRSAAFGTSAEFSSATFGGAADFADAVFEDGPTFSGTVFGGSASFLCASFGRCASFNSASFGKEAFFKGAAFGDSAEFNQTHFKGKVEFAGMSLDQWTTDIARTRGTDTKAFTVLKQRHEQSWNRYGSGPDRFLTISFAGTRFNGEAIFSGRSFEKDADFTGARFWSPPDFDGADKIARIDFTGAHVGFAPPSRLLHWTGDSRIPCRLRAFRKIAEETKNHDLERDLYIEERKAERCVRWYQLRDERNNADEEHRRNLEEISNQIKDIYRASERRAWTRITYRLGIADICRRRFRHLLWIIVMWVYWALADYGRSLSRPFLAWAVLTFIAFPWLYNRILMPPPKTADAGQYEQAVQAIARANAVPFVGSLTIDADIKKVLFCENKNSNNCQIPSKFYQWAMVGQNFLSIILVFFIGLALRNYFKIK